MLEPNPGVYVDDVVSINSNLSTVTCQRTGYDPDTRPALEQCSRNQEINHVDT